MFLRRRRIKNQQPQLEQLDIIHRLLKEIELSKHNDFTRYSIRKACRVKVTVFSEDLVMLNDWVTIAHDIVSANDYVTEKWKVIKKQYGSLMLDEYFSEKGYDINPELVIKRMLPKLTVICQKLADDSPENQTRRVYYLRHFKSIIEDGIEVLSNLRTMLL